MRLYDWSIPSAFLEFDSDASTADKYLNTRDIKTVVDNHNKLLAHRARKPLISQVMRDSTTAGQDPLLIQSIEPVSVNRSSGQVCFGAPIWIPPACFEVVVNIRAAAQNTGEGYEDIKIYPVIDGPEQRPDIDTSLAMTVSGTSEAKYTATVPVPQSAVWAREGYLHLYYLTPLYTTASKGAVALTDVGRGPIAWIEGDYDAAYTGDFAVCDTDVSILPMQIVYADLNVHEADRDRLYFGGPWPGPVPVPGTDTFSIHPANKLKLWTVTAYPVEITDWYAARGV